MSAFSEPDLVRDAARDAEIADTERAVSDLTTLLLALADEHDGMGALWPFVARGLLAAGWRRESIEEPVESVDCPWCAGSGQIMGPRVGGRVTPGITCKSCNGSGRIEEAK